MTQIETRHQRAHWRRASLPMIAVLALALGLRLHHLGAESLWLDELMQVEVAQRPLSRILDGVRSHYAAMPLDYLIVAAVVRVSHAEWALRLPAAIWGVLSVFLLFRIGRRLHSSEAGMAAAIFLAANGFHIRYCQEVRFYALFVFLALLSTDALLTASRTGTRRAWGRYALTIAIGLYAHLHTALVVVFHGIYLAAEWGDRRATPRLRRRASTNILKFMCAGAAAAIAFAPWLAFWRAGVWSGHWHPALDWQVVEKMMMAFIGWGAHWRPWAAVAALGLVTQFRRDFASACLLAAWIVFPLPLVILADQRYAYFFSMRQVLFALPIYLLLVAFGSAAVAHFLAVQAARFKVSEQGAYGVAMGAVVLALAVSLLPQLRSYYAEPHSENWRDLGKQLEKNLQRGDLVYAGDQYVEFYSSRAAGQIVTTGSGADLDAAYRARRAFWVVVTPYVADDIRQWTETHRGQMIDFGKGMRLHYFPPSG